MGFRFSVMSGYTGKVLQKACKRQWQHANATCIWVEIGGHSVKRSAGTNFVTGAGVAVWKQQKNENQGEERENEWETVICAFIKGCWSNFPSETMHAKHQKVCIQAKMITCWFFGTQKYCYWFLLFPQEKTETHSRDENRVFKRKIRADFSKKTWDQNKTVIGQPEESKGQTWKKQLKIKRTACVLARGCHSPIQLQRLGSALTLQQAPPLPHGHLTGVLSGVQMYRCVVHRWTGRVKAGWGGGGWVGDRRWQWLSRRRRAGVGGGGSECRRRGGDERCKRRLGERWFMLRSVAPIRPGGLVVVEGGGGRGVSVVLRWWMWEGHRFDDV